MPRLVGKSSNTAAYTTIGLLLLALAAGTALEYEGIIDVIPGFGKAMQTQRPNIDRTIAPRNNSTN